MARKWFSVSHAAVACAELLHQFVHGQAPALRKCLEPPRISPAPEPALWEDCDEQPGKGVEADQRVIW